MNLLTIWGEPWTIFSRLKLVNGILSECNDSLLDTDEISERLNILNVRRSNLRIWNTLDWLYLFGERKKDDSV
jgi:hypothetical protein